MDKCGHSTRVNFSPKVLADPRTGNARRRGVSDNLWEKQESLNSLNVTFASITQSPTSTSATQFRLAIHHCDHRAKVCRDSVGPERKLLMALGVFRRPLKEPITTYERNRTYLAIPSDS